MSPPRRQPGSTIRQVAALAGVSVSTVSRVVNDHADVSDEMRSRVLAAAESLSYSPSPIARALRGGKTGTVGFLVRDLATPFFADVAHGISSYLGTVGASVVIATSNDKPATDASQIDVLEKRGVDGLIVSVSDEGSKVVRAALERLEIPVVLLDREIEGTSYSAVVSDHVAGVRTAAEHLLSNGHERIWFLSGSTRVRPTRERIRGLVEATKSAGLSTRSLLIETAKFNVKRAAEQVEKWFALRNPPTAIVAGGGQAGIGALMAARALSLKVGRDFSLIVCDDLPLLDVMEPSISVVSRDAHALGEKVAATLIDVIDGGEVGIIVMPTWYEARSSVTPMRDINKPASGSP